MGGGHGGRGFRPLHAARVGAEFVFNPFRWINTPLNYLDNKKFRRQVAGEVRALETNPQVMHLRGLAKAWNLNSNLQDVEGGHWHSVWSELAGKNSKKPKIDGKDIIAIERILAEKGFHQLNEAEVSALKGLIEEREEVVSELQRLLGRTRILGNEREFGEKTEEFLKRANAIAEHWKKNARLAERADEEYGIISDILRRQPRQTRLYPP